MPTTGTPAASTALPHPPRTSQNVPRDSAPYAFMDVFIYNFSFVLTERPSRRAGRVASVPTRSVRAQGLLEYAMFVVPMVPLKANGAWSK